MVLLKGSLIMVSTPFTKAAVYLMMGFSQFSGDHFFLFENDATTKEVLEDMMRGVRRQRRRLQAH